ncbi:MAG TPA: DUF2147 domain-containing protein [Alphaproteobacteria bacterium]|jgi:uncharacterized protein (DUF2147 family)|nr:DUF2147 domain-containing protein [Alphaproteobacteria bacterium]
MIRLALCVALLSLNVAAAQNPAAPAAPAKISYPTEYWVSEKDGWTVKTGACGDELCAWLVDFKLRPNDPPGYQPVDENNPDRNKRTDKMCGHLMMGGFHPSKDPDLTWDGGWIYDPDHGSTYSGKIALVDKDTVKLRGFIGISLLGKTLVLRRHDKPPQLCDDPKWTPLRADK